MKKLSEIVLEVLSDYQSKDIRNENIRLEIAQTIEQKWKNVVKEVAKNVITKKAIEQLERRINRGIITGPSDSIIK